MKFLGRLCFVVLLVAAGTACSGSSFGSSAPPGAPVQPQSVQQAAPGQPGYPGPSPSAAAAGTITMGGVAPQALPTYAGFAASVAFVTPSPAPVASGSPAPAASGSAAASAAPSPASSASPSPKPSGTPPVATVTLSTVAPKGTAAFAPARKTKNKDEIVPIGLLYIVFTPTTPGVVGGAPLFDITLSAEAFAKYGAKGDYRLAYRDGTQKKAAYVMDADLPVAVPSPKPSATATASAAPPTAKPARGASPAAITVTAAPTIAPVHIVFSGMLPTPPIKVGSSLAYVLYVVPTPKPTVAPSAAPSAVASPAAPVASGPAAPAAPAASAPSVNAPASITPAPAATVKP
jgi:hypothetical protein